MATTTWPSINLSPLAAASANPPQRHRTKAIRHQGKIIFPRIRRGSPYLQAYTGAIQNNDKPTTAHLNGAKQFLLKTRGVRGGIPTEVAQALLIGVRSRVFWDDVTGSSADMILLKSLGLFHAVPCVPRKKKSHFRTSAAGVELLQYWRDTDKKFVPFYNAYVSEKDVGIVKGWSVALAMGLEVDIIANAEREAAAEMKKIEEEQQAVNNYRMQIQMQQALLQQQYEYTQQTAKQQAKLDQSQWQKQKMWGKINF